MRVGAYTEIGPHVEVGKNTRIGAMCFVCEGVRIGADCFIGPRVTFTNDKYPPSGKDKWQDTRVEAGAAIGAATTILCGVTIGKRALIGAGSVVTTDVPAGQVWCGNPARYLRDRDDNAAYWKELAAL